MDFTQATGTPPADQQAPMGSFAAQQQQVPPEVMAMNKPATSPEELEVRKAGWLQIVQKVTSDPNLMRAIGMAGSTLMQPKDWGDTNAGKIGSAYQVGQSAYDFGKQAETDQRYAAAKENRAQETHVADIAGKQANTEQTQVETVGKKTANEIAIATKTETIAKAKLYNDNLDIQIKQARTQQERDALHLAKEKHLKEIFDQIPDATLRQQAIDEATKQGVINAKNKAEASYYGAHAVEATARSKKLGQETEAQRLENEAQASLSPAERAAQGAKGGSSGATATATLYRNTWKEANPGATDQQAAQATEKFMTGARARPDDENFIKWAGLYGSGDYAKDRKAYDAVQGKTPAGSTPGGAATGVQNWGRDAKGNPVLIKEK